MNFWVIILIENTFIELITFFTSDAVSQLVFQGFSIITSTPCQYLKNNALSHFCF